jgi:hypothetical protein
MNHDWKDSTVRQWSLWAVLDTGKHIALGSHVGTARQANNRAYGKSRDDWGERCVSHYLSWIEKKPPVQDDDVEDLAALTKIAF